MKMMIFKFRGPNFKYPIIDLNNILMTEECGKSIEENRRQMNENAQKMIDSYPGGPTQLAYTNAVVCARHKIWDPNVDFLLQCLSIVLIQANEDNFLSMMQILMELKLEEILT